MNDQGQDDNKIIDERVDFMTEAGTGPDAANFSARTQQEKFLGGVSKSSADTLKPQAKESEWPMGARKSVEVNGRKWEYLEYGNPEGQPILNVHGWLGSSAEGQDRVSRAFAGEPVGSPGMKNLGEYKDPQNPDKDYGKISESISDSVRGIKGKYHVISPELPGFGKTQALDKVSLDAIADELAAFQRAIGAEKTIVFGSSMGGILATKLAARHPEEVKAIILQGTMTRPEDMNKIPYIAAQLATIKPVAALLNKFNISKNLFASIVRGSKDFKIADEETRQRIINDTLSADASTASATLREIGKNIEDDINKVQCPVVVLDGADGDLVPIMNSAKAAARFHQEIPQENLVSEKKVVFLPVGGRTGEQGHNIINTFPEGVAALIDDVVGKL